jgi:glycosyltransferase involved in cell wall biosynthesis
MLDNASGSQDTGSRAEVDNFLFFPAATVSHKNHRVLIDYASLSGSRPVICVGPEVEPLHRELVELAAAKRANIRFLGRVSNDEMNQLYSTCWALVMPSKYEAASGPIMEAFARGVPVLAATTPALMSQVEQSGGAVCWFEADSAQSLDQAERELSRKYSAYEEGSWAGGRWYASLTWAGAANQYLSVMDQHLTAYTSRAKNSKP